MRQVLKRSPAMPLKRSRDVPTTYTRSRSATSLSAASRDQRTDSPYISAHSFEPAQQQPGAEPGGALDDIVLVRVRARRPGHVEVRPPSPTGELAQEQRRGGRPGPHVLVAG